MNFPKLPIKKTKKKLIEFFKQKGLEGLVTPSISKPKNIKIKENIFNNIWLLILEGAPEIT